MKLIFKEMTKEHAENILMWKYEIPYDFYNNDVTEENIFEMMNGNYRCFLNEEDEIIGFFCIGEAARVPAGHPLGIYKEVATDIGLGMNPKLVGKGHGVLFCQHVLDQVQKIELGSPLRLTVASFNKRATHLYEELGFKKKDTFHKGTVEFITMVKTEEEQCK
ncbi:GNAT family N-acetyltransferase [Bacillus sp. THAF10]|uniref:GNAT family N-acetyltransferase n=1 Tax=Bacillus sp. THAF10 TaxID=2587848 RepID=UPI0020A62A04|nr:GNAT family N-acetyltransferase [Bacillus sp. THAF10]